MDKEIEAKARKQERNDEQLDLTNNSSSHLYASLVGLTETNMEISGGGDFIRDDIITQYSQLPDDVVLQCVNLIATVPDTIENVNTSPLLKIALNIKILKNERFLVCGPSGCGKTTLLRCLAGLWTKGSGKILWNECHYGYDKGNRIMFLPQKPFNFQGSIKQQIVYPEASSSDEAQDDLLLQGILDQSQLGSLTSQLYTVKDWSKVLSVGEQQKLAFARIIYHQPNLVLLDEATSGLDLFSEDLMYELLNRHNIAYLSAGHRPSLLKYHNKKLIFSTPSEDLKTVDITEMETQNFNRKDFI